MRRVIPLAYIRRSSRSRSDPGDLSREFQTEKVRELAGADGAALRIIDADWGQSAATDKTDQRIAFLELLAQVERGEVSALYAYATDRLARSVEWSARLLNACRRAGTVIVTSEGRFEPDNQLTDQLFYFQAMQNEGYSRQAQAKRKATVARQRARGDKLGPTFYGSKPGESIEAVLAAFDECGSAHRTAILLNERGIRTRRGGPWTHATVRQILTREGRIPRFGVRGAKPHAPFALYQLGRCHCGRTMTGVRVTHQRGKEMTKPRVLYRCINGSTDPGHGVKSIAETKVLDWVRERVDRAIERLAEREGNQVAAAAEAERTALDAERERLVLLFSKGKVDEATFDRLVEPVDKALAEAAEAVEVVDLPPIDWTWPAEDVNRLLRRMIDHVVLGRDLRPVRIEWRGRIAEWAS